MTWVDGRPLLHVMSAIPISQFGHARRVSAQPIRLNLIMIGIFKQSPILNRRHSSTKLNQMDKPFGALGGMMRWMLIAPISDRWTRPPSGISAIRLMSSPPFFRLYKITLFPFKAENGVERRAAATRRSNREILPRIRVAESTRTRRMPAPLKRSLIIELHIQMQYGALPAFRIAGAKPPLAGYLLTYLLTFSYHFYFPQFIICTKIQD